MPRLLTDILCVIETFHKYASEDGDKAALTPGELRQLLDVEFGDFLQPHVFHAVERKLNLLDIDRNGSISFEEFVLTIFSLLKLCYLDIQSLNSEPRQASNTEKTRYVDPGATTRNGQLADQGMASSTRLGHEEGDDAVGHNQLSPPEDIKTRDSPGEASEPSGSQNQHVEEDEQEAAQDVPVTEDDGAYRGTRTTLEGSRHTSILTEEIPPEKDRRPLRRLSSTKVGDHSEEENLEPQKETAQRPPEPQKETAQRPPEPQKETAQRPPDDRDFATERGVKKCAKPQVPFPREDEASSEHAGPWEAVTRKPSQTQGVMEPVADNKRAETQEAGKDAVRSPPETRELSAQERQDEPSDQSAQSSSRNVPEADRGEERIPEAQKKHQRKTQPPALETQAQEGKYQKLQGSSREQDTEEGSRAEDLSSEEGSQNHPELEGKETRRAETGRARSFAIGQNNPTAEATSGAREPRHDVAALGEQSQEHLRDPRPHDKPVGEEGGYEGKDLKAPAAQHESSPETPNSLAPETRELHVPEDSQSRVDPRGGSVQGDHQNKPDARRHGVPDGSSRAQKVKEEDVRLPGEQEPPAREHNSPGLDARGVPGAAMEPNGHSETQESAEGADDTKPLLAESSRGLDATGFPEQTSVMELPGREGSGGEGQARVSDTREEDGIPGTQEAVLKNLGEDNSASPTTDHGQKDPAALGEEDESPQEPADVDDQNSHE